MPALPDFFDEEEWVDLCEKIIATNAIMAQQTVKNFYLFTKPYLELLKMKALPRAIENESLT